jgi:hypothetical protein
VDLKLGHLPSGLYLVELISEKERKVVKLIIEN